MSIEKIHLRKLLKFFYLPDRERRSALREDIRTDIKKATSKAGGGGDFHVPFWTDAKNHVRGIVNLRDESNSRVASNKGRERLYPQLTSGFLKWWDEKRRWRNEPFEFIPLSISAHFPVPGVPCEVKVENLLALKVGSSSRIIYPYFSEQPVLVADGAQIGLWLMGEALQDYALNDMRILDILRGASFATTDVPLQGDEHKRFIQKFKSLSSEWHMLRQEYLP